jgi:hypothetical protein
MSTIGSASSIGMGIAGSIVGSSLPEGASDRSKASAAEQRALDGHKDVLSKSLGDVADPEFGSDRDADGRLLYRRSGQPAGSADDETAASLEASTPRPADAFGVRGKALDIEA